MNCKSIFNNHFFKGVVMKKVVAVTQLALCLVLVFCNCGDAGITPSKLVGHWVYEYKSDVGDMVEHMELFKDGTGVMAGLFGNSAISWKVEGKRFVILSSDFGMSRDYKISGYKLTLIDNDGNTKIYVRKENLEKFKAQQAAEMEKQAKQICERGIDALYNEKYDEAIERFGEAIKLSPDYFDAYFNRGLAYHSKKDYNNAIEDFNKSIELDPNDWEAYYSRGGAYYDDWLACMRKHGRCDQKDYGRIVADFNKSIELTPDDVDELPKVVLPQNRGKGQLPETDIPQRTDGEKLNLKAIITDSVVALGNGGFMPALFYKEFHRYVTKEQDLDTLIEYVPGGTMPKHPRSGRYLTIHERYAIYLFAADENRYVIKSMYTKSGEMVTNDVGNPVETVNVGDTVFALTNPRRHIVVANPADFESKPLSVYDETLNSLMKIKERYRNSMDGNDIIIAVEDGVHYDKLFQVMYAARIAEFPNISFAKLTGGGQGTHQIKGKSSVSSEIFR